MDDAKHGLVRSESSDVSAQNDRKLTEAVSLSIIATGLIRLLTAAVGERVTDRSRKS